MSREDLVRAMLFLGLIALVYVAEAGIWFRYILQRLKQFPNAPRVLFGRFALCIHAMALLGVLCAAYGFWIEPYWVEVKHIELCCYKLNGGSFRLVQISDTHCDLKPRNETKVVEIINALNPDVIVFTGDSLNDLQALPRFQEMLHSLKASKGKFAVRGNIDNHYFPTVDLFADTGFQVLNGEIQTVESPGNSITISGLSYGRQDSFRQLTGKLDRKALNLFLYHTPDLVDPSVKTPVDLYLAGHLHGGQVALPLYGALITMSPQGKKYESGRYDLFKPPLYGSSSVTPAFARDIDSMAYVNRGIGMEGGIAPRVRFCARPEITVFDIRSPEDYLKHHPYPDKKAMKP
ncbi:MAG: hypothetical protein GX455_05385 [Phycisphaerae bacterium]|nr:hypothetical protein [Phycisphaerae bacterium]